MNQEDLMQIIVSINEMGMLTIKYRMDGTTNRHIDKCKDEVKKIDDAIIDLLKKVDGELEKERKKEKELEINDDFQNKIDKLDEMIDDLLENLKGFSRK